MKETEPKNEIVIESVKRNEIEKQLKLLGRMPIKPNHKLFEIDLNKGEIREAKFIDNPDVNYNDVINKKYQKVDLNNPKPKTKSKYVIDETCFYISALNFKNCKKVLKNKFGLVFND